MSVASVNAGGDFRVGEVLSRAGTVLVRNFVFCCGIILLTYAVFIVAAVVLVGLGVITGQIGAGTVNPGAVPFIVVAIFAMIIVLLAATMVGEAAILFGAFQYLRGQPVRMGAALGRATGRLLPLIGLGFLWGLGVFVGMLLLVVPGAIIAVMWAVVVPACVVEGLGPVQSLARSAELTKGHRWKIFGILILLALINGLGSNLVALILSPAGSIVSSLGSAIATIVLTAYGHCAIIMTYHDLRVAKEGIDIEQIAAVFD